MDGGRWTDARLTNSQRGPAERLRPRSPLPVVRHGYDPSDAHAHSSLRYATEHIPVAPANLIARIGTTNAPSISLFHSLGFETVKVVEVFSEAELRFSTTGSTPAWQGIQLGDRLGHYDP
jgi:hypothetical protein